MEQAIPPRLFPQRLRIAVYGFVFVIFGYNFVDVKLWGTCGPDCPKMVVQGYVELSALDVLGKSFFLAAVLALHGGYRAYRYCSEPCIYDSGLRFGSHSHTGPFPPPKKKKKKKDKGPVCRFPEQAVLLQAKVPFSELHMVKPQQVSHEEGLCSSS